MSTVVYLANQQIQVIEGNRSSKGAMNVRRYLTLEAPEGSVINGVIMDEDGFVEFLRDAWKEAKLPTKDIILLINSSKFVGRTIELPALNEKNTYEYISRDFADVGREEVTQIFSYIPVGKVEAKPEAPIAEAVKKDLKDKKKKTGKNDKKDNKKKKTAKQAPAPAASAKGKLNRLYVEGVDHEYVSDCISIFSSAGLKLSAVYSDGSNLITLCGATSAKRHKTFVLLVADAMTLTTILWVNGTFNYGNTVRCFFDQGTQEYADDVARTVNQLVQFLKSSQSDAVLESIEIAGIDPSDMEMYANAIAMQGTDAPVSLFSAQGGSTDPELQKYLHTVSGLYGTYKTQDFLNKAIHFKKSEENKGLNDTLKLFIPAFVVLIIMSAVYITMSVIKSNKNKELDALNEYNERPDVMMQASVFDSLKARTEFLVAQYNAINEIDEDILTYPCGNSDVMQVFRTCAAGYADVEFGAFDARNGTLTITAKASEVEQINKFIRRLMDDPTFNEVNYTGYDYMDDEAKWKINITTTLAEAAGRGDVKKLLEELTNRRDDAAKSQEEEPEAEDDNIQSDIPDNTDLENDTETTDDQVIQIEE